jgi:hypothetical protein
MAYQKTNWVNNQTPLNENNLNKLEQGVKDAHDEVDQHELEIDTIKDVVYNDHALRISTNELHIEEGDLREAELKARVDDLEIDKTNLETTKQDKLVAGANITIDPNTNVISAIGGGNSSNPDGVTIVLNEDDKLEVNLKHIMNGGYL